MVNTSTTILQADNLVKTVSSPEGPLTILTGVSLKVQQGETVAVLGVSGSGKSTLLGLLAGLDQPSSGTVIFSGNNLASLDEDGRARLRAGRVGFVFQSFQLLPNLTALENVMLPLELSTESLNGSGPPRLVAADILAQIGLTERVHHYPSQLSGGEQQRVAIARAYATQPELLFADEPTGNLDKQTGEVIAQLLFDLNEKLGTTLVLVTHDKNLAERCQRRLYIDNGRLEARTE